MNSSLLESMSVNLSQIILIKYKSLRNNGEKAYYQRILENIKRFIKAKVDYVVRVIEEGKYFFSLMVEGSMSLLCTHEQ